AHGEEHRGIGTAAGGADPLPRTLRVGIGAVTGGPFEVRLGQTFENPGMRPLHVIAFEMQHRLRYLPTKIRIKNESRSVRVKEGRALLRCRTVSGAAGTAGTAAEKNRLPPPHAAARRGVRRRRFGLPDFSYLCFGQTDERMANILIIDDEEQLRRLLSRIIG